MAGPVVDQVGTGTAGAVNNCTTAAVASAASVTCYAVICKRDFAAFGTLSVTDSKGNTYTQIGAQGAGASSNYVARFICAAGTGGSGHTLSVTDTAAGGSTIAWNIYLVTITGSSGLDVQSLNSVFSAPPVTGTAVTTTAANDLLLSVCVAANTPYTFAESTGCTIIGESGGAGSSNQPVIAIGSKTVAVAGSANVSWTTGNTDNFDVSIDTFLAAPTAIPSVGVFRPRRLRTAPPFTVNVSDWWR